MQSYKSILLASLVLGMTLYGGKAQAGPVMTFGELDENQLRIDYKGQFQLVNRDTGSGADGEDATTEFNFRRNRIALLGAMGDKIGLYVQTEFTEDKNIGPLDVSDGNSSEFEILDAQLRFTYNPMLQVRVGKFKYNLTRENLEECEGPLTLDRSLFIRAPLVDDGTRDKGVAIFGNIKDGLFQYRADIMNGRNDSVSAPDSSLRYSVRGHVSLGDSESDYGYKGTYLGKKKVLTLGAAYQMEADIAYADTVNETGSVDYNAYTFDIFAEYPIAAVGTFTASAAYVNYDLDDAYQGNNPDSGVIGLNGEKKGGYVKAAYMLPKLPLQFFARGEQWKFAQLKNVIDQEINWYAGGLNYYFQGQDVKLTFEYAMTDFDKEGVFAGEITEDFNTLTTQLQVMF
jgi:hypothetical protein